ncbi:MAG: TlpA disulfide reductase family protein [Rhodocyclaceae bacterium]|nr:TlpA disulfide reductase family protein [Rhodocyclaceae bacterium]
MRFLVAILLALALTVPAAAAGLVADPARPAAAVRDGKLAEALAQREGSPVIVNFWASWCEPCRAEMPSLQRLAERWRGRGLSVLTVAVGDRPEQAERFLWESGVVLPLLHDPDQALAHSLSVRALPTTLVLDGNRRIVARGRGAIDWDDAAVDRQLQNLLK